jgi:hypothetical protein
MKTHFLKKSIALCGIILVLAMVPLSVPEARAQEQCETGPAILQTTVFCWAEEAVSFVMANNLFSVLEYEDLRDAVKAYRFYQLMMTKNIKTK